MKSSKLFLVKVELFEEIMCKLDCKELENKMDEPFFVVVGVAFCV